MGYRISQDIINYDDSIKLDLNEFDFEHVPELYDNIISVIVKKKTLTHYSNKYNDNNTILVNRLCQINNIDESEILLTAGSDNALEYITNTYVTAQTRVIVFVPTYNNFINMVSNITEHVTVIPVDLYKDCDYRLALKYYNDIMKGAVVYIVNPNNPTGHVIQPHILQLLTDDYLDTLFIIDEAYIEYCKEYSMVNYRKDNIIITRTFSKAYGCAGARLGYIISNKMHIQNIEKIYNEKHVTEIAKVVGRTIVDNLDYYEKIIATVVSLRTDFTEFLGHNKIEYIKSNCNYVSVYVGDTLNAINIFKRNNIYVRDKNDDISMAGYIRITIGNRDSMQLIKDTIADNIQSFADKFPIQKHYTDKNHIWKLKYLFKEVMDVINASTFKDKCWITGNTLLGITRHNGIIPWKDTIDIAYSEEGLITLEKQLNDKGIRLIRTDHYYQCYLMCDSAVHVNLFTYTDAGRDALRVVKFYDILDVNIPNNYEDLLIDIGIEFETTDKA